MKQGFAWWSAVQGAAQVDDLLEQAAAIGYDSVDFLPEEHWERARACGLEVLVIDGHDSIEVGFNDPSRHEELSRQVREAIEKAAGNGIPFVTVAPGDRVDGGVDGMEACVAGLAPLAAEAEATGTVLLVEPLNTKVDHPGHECSTTGWAADLVDRLGSPSLRILFDFYHAQIMEGDLLRTVEAHWDRIAHFHTAGVPGRHEPGIEQEIGYAHLAAWLHGRGYAGHVTHEYMPVDDVVASLGRTFEIFAQAPSGTSTTSLEGRVDH
jgi:hydroxypyruvate isomerase